MKKPYLVFSLFLCVGMLFMSCKRDMYDSDAYQQLIAESSPFDTIDPQHTWNLTQVHSVVVVANPADVQKISSVRILTDNPYTSEDAEILAEAFCSKGDSVTLFYSSPVTLSRLYAAVSTADGRWLLKVFYAGQQQVDFVSDVLSFEGTPKSSYQTYTYCFEDTYPEPGDNDFNDIVMRIQKLPSLSKNEIRLRISLVAVGTLRQVASAIRLVGYDYADVEEVTIVEGHNFDPDYTIQRYFIDSSDLLLKGIHGEAVLNLFEDAHFAMYPVINTSTDGSSGSVRCYYNTYKETDGQLKMQVSEKTLTYVVKLRNSKTVQNFTLEDIDPFILKDFNSGKWEIHTFAYKAVEVLHELGVSETANSTRMTWALKIPYAQFRYPQEGNSMGSYRDGILSGAYMTPDHSLGQWVANCAMSTDWFRYPAAEMVY